MLDQLILKEDDQAEQISPPDDPPENIPHEENPPQEHPTSRGSTSDEIDFPSNYSNSRGSENETEPNFYIVEEESISKSNSNNKRF